MEATEKQKIAIAALIAGKKRAECAKLAGVAEATIYNWLADEGFRTELKQAQNYLFDESTARLHGLLENSIEICRRILDGERLTSLDLRAANLVFMQVWHIQRVFFRQSKPQSQFFVFPSLP